MFLATKGDTSILVEIAFFEAKSWSGGKARSCQLYEILANAGYTMTRIDEPARPSKFSLLLWAIRGVLRFSLYRPFSLDSLRTTGINFYRYRYFTKRYPDARIYIVEGTGFGQIQVARIAKALGRKIVLVPANIESLAPYDVWTHRKGTLFAFREELQYYKESDAIFCISQDETWLLRVFGCNAFFLPYYPPKVLIDKILSRRNARSSVQHSGLFYFANFKNRPNVLGLRQFIKEGKHRGKQIHIAGLHIDQVRDLLDQHPEFVILGELSEDELEEQLIKCEAVIINHFPTSGTLTRIPELLLSGIPVQGNMDAMRSYIYLVVDGTPEKHLESLSTGASLEFIDFLSSLDAARS